MFTKSFLDPAAQGQVVDAVRKVAEQAPFFQPDTPYGKPMSVRMTAAGRFGWFSDRCGYRYVEQHPQGMAWPAIPDPVLAIWDRGDRVGAAAGVLFDQLLWIGRQDGDASGSG